MSTKTLEELNAEEREYLLGRATVVPTTGEKVSTHRKKYEERRDAELAQDEKRYAKQRQAQAERNAEFTKTKKLADPNDAVTIIADKVVKVKVALDGENVPETASNAKEGNVTGDTDKDELPSKSALLGMNKADLIKLANERKVEVVHDVDTVAVIVDKLLA